jgi:thioredoxin reductase
MSGPAPIDVIIVGGGPAGLNAALVLGRCLRQVLVLDAGQPRNRWSHAVHNFLTRDGTPPTELRRLALEQLGPYETVRVRQALVIDAVANGGGFRVTLEGGEALYGRKLLLATGVQDVLPELEGFDALYGRSVFHCPYCDGWEQRGRPTAVLARGAAAAGLALELLGWTRDIVVCTDGPPGLSARDRSRLARHGIPVRPSRLARLEGVDGRLSDVVFADGTRLARQVAFFGYGQRQTSDLATRLGCALTRTGSVRTGRHEATHLPGLFVAGDASKLVQMAVVAAAEGAQAAFAINSALLLEDLYAEPRLSRLDGAG